MNRYIDAEWLKAFFEADKGKSRNTPIDSLLALIDDAPSIDIVKCGECKYSRECRRKDRAFYRWCTEWGRSTDTFGYCERGEREGE